MMNNEFEICKLTATTVYELLHSQVKGHIKVYVRDNILKIEIENWIEKCMIGNDYEIIVAGIVSCYKSALMKKYFY